jgi:hypothetical protein
MRSAMNAAAVRASASPNISGAVPSSATAAL